jgi:transglutaminase-like putative cysteine protease
MNAYTQSLQPVAADSPPTPGSLCATEILDFEHPLVRAFATQHALGDTDQDRAVALYYAVRDGFKYDPYRVDLSAHGMSASNVLRQGVGWCVPKAALLTAVCRAVGIPSRLGFADVRNHLSTERMRQSMQSDVFVWHGYSEIWLNGVWRKATPAFNLSLCEKFGFLPLDFDGHEDSIYHPFDRSGHRHMEYIRSHGSFDDLPLNRICTEFARSYPQWSGAASELKSSDFESDVANETSQ